MKKFNFLHPTIDQLLTALLLWILSAHGSWWNIAPNDVPGLRTGARLFFYWGCTTGALGALIASVKLAARVRITRHDGGVTIRLAPVEKKG